jgi:hypothetical protein
MSQTKVRPLHDPTAIQLEGLNPYVYEDDDGTVWYWDFRQKQWFTEEVNLLNLCL